MILLKLLKSFFKFFSLAFSHSNHPIFSCLHGWSFIFSAFLPSLACLLLQSLFSSRLTDSPNTTGSCRCPWLQLKRGTHMSRLLNIPLTSDTGSQRSQNWLHLKVFSLGTSFHGHASYHLRKSNNSLTHLWCLWTTTVTSLERSL